ncbi:GntR family transcriptional regulator (plasmid) [Nocardia sp. CA-084685]|uniref:winged helix-turn-helix domain-containing protein n=1 Tax=Nocardia sp. CA-084685 TaxID=3239970 RepID=UPI003D997820
MRADEERSASPTPVQKGLVPQVAAQIGDRIDSGEFGHGDQLPPLNTIAATYNVSRATASAAIELLITDGRVSRPRNRRAVVGTHVDPVVPPSVTLGAQRVAAQIIADIDSGELAAGDPLHVNMIATTYRVEDGIARAAIEILVADGRAVRLPNRPATVSSAQDVSETEWTAGDFSPGAFVRINAGTWHEVVQVDGRGMSVACDESHRYEQSGTSLYRQPAARPLLTLGFEQVREKLTGFQARARFPDAYAADAVQRPRRKKGRTRLAATSMSSAEVWRWRIGDIDYTATWDHPGGWSTTEAPVANAGAVQILIDDQQVTQLRVIGPTRFVEQVHNQVRDFVEEQARAFAEGGDAAVAVFLASE